MSCSEYKQEMAENLRSIFDQEVSKHAARNNMDEASAAQNLLENIGTLTEMKANGVCNRGKGTNFGSGKLKQSEEFLIQELGQPLRLWSKPVTPRALGGATFAAGSEFLDNIINGIGRYRDFLSSDDVGKPITFGSLCFTVVYCVAKLNNINVNHGFNIEDAMSDWASWYACSNSYKVLRHITTTRLPARNPQIFVDCSVQMNRQ
eukprot:6214520-Pleurochrysis_carterae.AAC.2